MPRELEITSSYEQGLSLSYLISYSFHMRVDLSLELLQLHIQLICRCLAIVIEELTAMFMQSRHHLLLLSSQLSYPSLVHHELADGVDVILQFVQGIDLGVLQVLFISEFIHVLSHHVEVLLRQLSGLVAVESYFSRISSLFFNR